MGLALYRLGGLEVWSLRHESLHRPRLAAQRVSFVLDLENSTWQTRAAGGAEIVRVLIRTMSRENPL